MKLNAVKRDVGKKGDLKRLRREGLIPSILYRRGKDNEALAVNLNDFQAILRDITPGHLPTTVISLKQGDKAIPVIVKEIQYARTTYAVTHLDLKELVNDQSVNVKVPVRCINEGECAGVKLGGFLRVVRRHVLVACTPGTMPKEFVIDLKNVGMRQSKRVRDIEMPEGVRALVEANEVVITIAK